MNSNSNDTQINQPPPGIANRKMKAALESIAEVLELEKQWTLSEDKSLTLQLHKKGLALYDKALIIFHAEGEPWLAVWCLLQQADIWVEIAGSAPPELRMEHANRAFELARSATSALENITKPNLRMIARFCLKQIDTLMRIRTLFTQPDLLEALDDLIREMSAHYGESLAMNEVLRGEAHDQLLAAQLAESLIAFEDDPQQREEMKMNSRHMALQAYEQLSASGDSNYTSALELLQKTVDRPFPKPADTKIKCTVCGAESARGTPFCSQCGTRLAREEL